MPKNIKYTDAEAINAVGNQVKQATGNVQVSFNTVTKEFDFQAPQGETIQSLEVQGKSLQIFTNKGTYTQDLSTVAGDTVTALSLEGNVLTLATDKGTQAVDLSGLIPATMGDTLLALSLTGSTLYAITDMGTKSVDLGNLPFTSEGVTSVVPSINGQDLTITTNKEVHTITLPQSGTILSVDTIAALGGTQGPPNEGNKFVTNADLRLAYIKPAGPANSFTLGTPATVSITTTGSAIIGGVGNMSVDGGGASVIIGGDNNQIQQYAAAIVGGGTNVIGSNGYFGGIVGGVKNEIHGQRSGMLGGEWSLNQGYASGMVGGYRNIIGSAARYSGMLAGTFNNLYSNNSAIIGGTGFDAPVLHETVFMPQVYLFKQGGGVSMVSTAGARKTLALNDAGQLTLDGTPVIGSSGGGVTTGALTDIEVGFDGNSFSLLTYRDGGLESTQGFTIPKQVKTDSWQVGGYYEPGSVVTHNGKLYISLDTQMALSYSDAPGINSVWRVMDLSGYAPTGGTTADVNKAYVDAQDTNLQQQINGIQIPSYTAGTGISISSDKVISVTGGGSSTGSALSNVIDLIPYQYTPIAVTQELHYLIEGTNFVWNSSYATGKNVYIEIVGKGTTSVNYATVSLWTTAGVHVGGSTFSTVPGTAVSRNRIPNPLVNLVDGMEYVVHLGTKNTTSYVYSVRLIIA